MGSEANVIETQNSVASSGNEVNAVQGGARGNVDTYVGQSQKTYTNAGTE
ncbi:hypothetical protein Tco_0496064, partial [Tanacetum coccineum]